MILLMDLVPLKKTETVEAQDVYVRGFRNLILL